MKPRTLVPLVIGLVVGFFAIKMGVDMIKRAKGSSPDQGTVLVSKRQIETATQVEATMLESKTVAASLVPPDSFTDVEKLSGRVSAMMIPPGVPITKQMLAPPGSAPGLRAKIPAGYRAVSVSVNEESAVAGFIVPGSRVDVSAASRSGESKLILSNVEIGAVGQSLSQVGPDGKTVRITKSVTLFLQPEQVQILHAHSGKGKINLALRGNSKDAPTDSLWSRLLDNARNKDVVLPTPKRKPKVVAPQPKRHVVEVVRGSEIEQLVFVEAGAGHYELASDFDRTFSQQSSEKEDSDDSDDNANTETGE